MEILNSSSKKRTILYVHERTEASAGFEQMLKKSYNVISVDMTNREFADIRSSAPVLSAAIVCARSAAGENYALFEWVKHDSMIEAVPMLIYCEGREDMEIAEECIRRGAVDVVSPDISEAVTVHRIENSIRLKDSATFPEIERMLKELPSNIYLKDAEGRYIFATHYWHHLDHSSEPEWTIRGKTDLDIRKDKENALKAMETDKEIIKTGKGTSYIIEEKADGVTDYLELIKRPVKDKDGKVTGIIALINNVTEQQLLRMSLEEKALKDELTGVFNRHYFDKYIECIGGIKRPISFISADCNYLKKINDTFGHFVGDEYIRMSAMLFKTILPAGAVIFRMGGDEFTMILPGVSEAEARGYIEKLEREQKTYRIMDRSISISYGISCMEESSGLSVRELLEAADMQMYKAKKEFKASQEEG